MKKIPLVLHSAAFSAALSCVPSLVQASTLYWDTDAAAGITAGSGTWDLNSTSNWNDSTTGSNSLPWTNGNTAAFIVSGGNTVTLNGAVSAAGLLLSGGTNSLFTIGAGTGASLSLGAEGLAATFTNASQQVLIGAPVVLTANQTWSSNGLRANQFGGVSVRVDGAVSGTANLTFDGHGLAQPTATGNTSNRTTFALGGNNTYSGTTTISKGASLFLDYSTNGGSKLDDASALVLAGGSLRLYRGTNVVEVVGSTRVERGANTIFTAHPLSSDSGNAVNRIALGAITRGTGGTLDVSNAAAGLASTTTQNVSTGTFIGPWATFAGTRWARGSADGSDTSIVSYAGTTRTSSAAWLTTDNVRATANDPVDVGAIGDKTINTLIVDAAGVGLSFNSASTFKLSSGGIIFANTGQSINGGKITTGFGTGELFVHTAQNATIGSAVIDNTSTSVGTILVKAGANNLTLTGDSTHTGGTIINSGAINLAAGASLGSANITLDGGSFVMDAASSITFNIGGASAGQFDVFRSNLGTANLAGTVYFDFDGALSGVSGDWQLFSTADADSVQPSISGSIVLSGAYSATLTETDGLWTGTDLSGANFTFTEATGILNVSTIPEPSAFAALAGLAGLGLAASRRRRRA